ncbi:PH domain-containing protein [Metabacillus sp. RGM 3146]|uniref:PH domain-containing protein n=1 Tax=Metabacillus sp. RGM 3146 TaxID=3401092 RepID=UPI003B9C2488
MNEIRNKIEDMLDHGEIVLASFHCSLEIFIYRIVPWPGVLTATNKRVLFYAEGFMGKGNEIVNEYQYERIHSIKFKKELFGSKMVFAYDSEWYKFLHVKENDADTFMEAVKEYSVKGSFQ